MTQGEVSTKFFSEDYAETCFQSWFSLNCPTNMDVLLDAIPTTPEGRKPTKAWLRDARDTMGWVERADGMKALAVQKADAAAIDRKADLLIKQARETREVIDKAREHILENGFDSTSSAVKAYLSGIEQEREIVGISNFLTKISIATEEDLQKRAVELLRRKNEAVTGVIVEEENADERSETSE